MKSPLSLLHFRSGKHLPVTLQTEMAECGLACLTMVATYHGHAIDLNTLRRDYPISLTGASLNNIMETAEKLKFTTRPLRLELEELDQLQAPCILHWDMNHFVVLKKATEKGVVIHDPAQGQRTLTYEETSKHFTGVALELYPATDFEEKDERQRLPLDTFFKRMKGLKSSLAKILGVSLVLQIFAVVSPFFMQLVVDEAIVTHDTNLLVVLSLGFLMLALIQTAVTALRGYIVLYISSVMNIQMAANLFRHLIRLPLSYFEKRHIGDVVSRFGSLGKIRELLTTQIIEAIVDGLMTVITLVMMFLYAPLLTWVVIGSVTLYAIIRALWYRPLRALTEESIISSAKENSTFIETIRAQQSIKIFAKESQRQTVWENRYADMLNANIRVGKLGLVYNAINSTLFGIENILVVYLGAGMVFDGALSVGMLFAFVSYKQQFTGKASELIQKWIELKMLGLHLERIADIALTPVEIPESVLQAARPRTLTGKIEVSDLSFQYDGADKPVFSGLNFEIDAGESVAIVGPSGCGKTTLMKVLMGLFPASGGKLLVDDTDISTITIPEYRRHITSVMQNDQLMSGSIGENIAFFDTHPDQERVEACAQLASIHTDITRLPMAYNTLIGDMGTTLSGGQKQRVLLARALYKDPKILFLDEATSHLDVALEQQVNSHVSTLPMTRIIVAHRPETIRSADRILLMTPNGVVDKTDEMKAAASAAAVAE